MKFRVLAINPGSTSTKVAVYDDDNLIMSESIAHSSEELSKYKCNMDQLEMRTEAIEKLLEEKGIDVKSLNAVVGRGGALPPVKSGAYRVNDLMIDTLKNRPVLDHASNLGAVIAKSIADSVEIDSFIYDSISVDEMSDVARISGLKDFERTSMGHALNTRAMALKYAKDKGLDYKSLNLIVAHVGGGATVYLHEHGQMSDMISDDEGPFSPDRSGRVPCIALIEECYENKFSLYDMKKKIRGKGGIYSYLNTNDLRKVEEMISDGDKYAEIVYDAMVYQMAKAIGEMATVVDGDVDAIIVTGGIAHSNMFTSKLKKKIKFISHVEIMPGENEMESLAFGALRVLKGEETAREFK
ncbi:butyrate kinase [Peptacetobacter hiranonis]|uniref:Probable butyrate kinase n=1 Tax=Peptacetobacter hiranonis (strain DSM 13275 / JCM 10541 / KCTC 15199 / TO-931) TaxID=500633 RepID=B6FWA6_PEPHT|nr:butyrate kinase [Peptacetobacter hiranonis]EEA86233.1 butyrate kinase [Peptacetobacter hiranonis DSM 13275]QEK21302.1 Butyrate kinase 2 [Peptacetobacter hiranonis]